ncbi:WAT1-related protein At4g28040 [Aegilops tauschii subsp. strangulata]|uniref:WAT1-related protein n=4 Tax=Triticinae TaxID=1648030 RepID=A0A453KWA3_AEGTS|nr:WAT1-related protein At4g28040 [Aegilops tauschii subsp. strangulata]
MLLLSRRLPRARAADLSRAMAMAGGGWRAWAERHKPCVAMVLVQLFYSLVDMALKTAYGLGMRPIVFVAYRQGIAAAALLLASLAARGLTLRPMAVGPRAFALLFLASLASATGQYFYFMGLQLASPSMARATTNLAPGITFAIAAVIGLEKVDLRSSRSIAKIVGTVVCLAGAMLMAFFKGPKLLGALLLPATGDWVKGGIYLMGNAFCFSIWYILQVPVCKSYLDPLSLATWMCFLATLQCAVMAFFLEANYMEIWKLASIWELPCILYGGVFASGANFFMQSWCISVKGPLYSAIFTPLSAVITTILSTLVLHEELHIGSVLGAIVIILGLYVVLWGKADDASSEGLAIRSDDSESILEQDCMGVKVESGTNLSEPLLLSENADADASRCQ